MRARACARRRLRAHLVLRTLDVGHRQVVRRGDQVLHLLAREDVDGNEVALCVTVLASLRGADVNHLARTALDDHVAVLANETGLHRESARRTGIGRLELLGVIRVSLRARGGRGWRGGGPEQRRAQHMSVSPQVEVSAAEVSMPTPHR